MLSQLRPSISILALMTIVTGILYPALVTVIAQTAFPHQANGSLITVDKKIFGSELIGQQFNRPDYFWSRLSATAPMPYNAAASGGSNLGPLNPVLLDNVKSRVEALRSQYATESAVPVDLVTSSGSGLDPHISPAAAQYQVARVAAARQLSIETVNELVSQFTESRQLGMLGEPRVNVLLLNIALDQLPPRSQLSSSKAND